MSKKIYNEKKREGEGGSLLCYLSPPTLILKTLLLILRKENCLAPSFEDGLLL